ncbi:hypothetical protein NQZ68_036668 [Dissostichus eleginoides]|nr:hypothetical protein NQZ68_036668 [Dissostichus eleginoides]
MNSSVQKWSSFILPILTSITAQFLPAGPSTSRVRTPESWAKFLCVRSSTELQQGSTMARISAPRCVKQHLSEDGRMDGCMDVDSK